MSVHDHEPGWQTILVLCGSVSLLACDRDLADWSATYGYEPDEAHRIRIGAYGFPFLPVVIDDDTVELAFDTGNMVGVSLVPEVLENLGLPRIDEWTRLGSDGSVIGRYGVHQADHVSVLGIELPSRRIFELEHPRLPGLVGSEFLRGKRFTLDYGRRVLALSDRPAPAHLDSLNGVPLIRSQRHPDLLLVYGSVEGRRVLMELDTGKSRTTIDPALAEALNLPGDEHGVAIRDLRLGSHTFSVPSAKRVTLRGIDPALGDPIQVGIGSDLLSELVLTVDPKSGKAWFQIEL